MVSSSFTKIADRLRSWVFFFFLQPVILNVAVLFLLSLLVFEHNQEFLFYGSDGKFEVTLIDQYPHFAPPLIGFTSDALRGLGNVIFPVNPYWIPAYFVPRSLSGQYSNFAITYAICACELMLATCVLAPIVQLPTTVGIIAGWLVPLLILPYFGFGLIHHTAAAFPHYGTAVAVLTAVIGMCGLIRGRSLTNNVAPVIAVIFGVSFIVIIAPALLIFALPMALALSVVLCINSEDWKERAVKVSIFTLTGVACLVMYGPFLAGLLLDTAANFFKGLSIRPAGMDDVSMLFWTSYPFLNTPRLFLAGGLIGAVVVALARKGRSREFAIALLLTEALFVGGGTLHQLKPFWFGPAFYYFEGLLFCYLAIFLVGGLYILASFALLTAGPYFPSRFLSIRVASPLIGAIIASAATIYVLNRGTTDTAGPLWQPHPEAETTITRILKDEISLASERRFRGRVADFIGRSVPEMKSFQVWHFVRLFALLETGNTHTGAGLWQDAIPTLGEYSPLMTPGYFAFMRSLFTQPDDLQTRNRVEMRHIDPRLLAILGVRFLITDTPFNGNLELRSELLLRVPDALKRTIGTPRVFSGSKYGLYLYEIPNPNLGQYSPVQVMHVTTAADILKTLASLKLDPTRTIVTSEILPEALVPAALEEFSIGRGDSHVRASSPGHSVLLLPIEYSNCLILTGAAPGARLFRANLILTGIVFERAIDVHIAYFTGPFANSTCRLRDRKEYVHMDIVNAFRDHPELIPENALTKLLLQTVREETQ